MTNCIRCSKRDYDQIVSQLAAFWGDNRSGFVTPGPLAYIHLVGGPDTHRHRGLARRLYDHFTARAVARGCRQLRVITSPQNTGSIQFHRSLGFVAVGEPGADRGVPVVKDYGGPGVIGACWRSVSPRRRARSPASTPRTSREW